MLVLLVYSVVIIIPPIMHGYVYPNIGDDSAMHLAMLDDMGEKGIAPFGKVYFGYAMVSYPILYLSRLTGVGVDTIFMWFNYAALILVGITVYFVMARLVNRETGWLALVITVFCSQSILSQFYYGVLFNMINVGIILPLLLWLAVEYITRRQKRYLYPFFGLVALYSSFHTTGIYLPAFISGIMVAYVLYNHLRKRPLDSTLLLVGVGANILSVTCLIFFIPDLFVISVSYVKALKIALTVPLMNYMWTIVSIATMMLLVFLVPYLVMFRNNWLERARPQVKVCIFILGCMAVILAVTTFSKLSGDPWRLALDLATVLALLVTVFAGIFMTIKRPRITVLAVLIIVGLGMYFSLPTWFGYNSAITQADKKAIEYVNSLGYNEYNCTTEVAPWIYSRFVKQEYTIEDSGLLIERNMPMTPRSTVGNVWYVASSKIYEPDSTYDLTRTFNDGEIVVNIFEKR
jgi:hypothetical protein